MSTDPTIIVRPSLPGIIFGLGGLLGGHGPPPFIEQVKKSPAWDDPTALKGLADEQRAIAAKGGQRGIVAQRNVDTLKKRIGQLRAPRVPEPESPFDYPDEPSPIVADQMPSPVFGMTIPGSVTGIFMGTRGAAAIAGAKRVLANIPKLETRGKTAGKVGKGIGAVVATEIGRGIIEQTSQSSIKENDRINRERDKIQKAEQAAAVDRVRKARIKAGLPAKPLQGLPDNAATAEKMRAIAEKAQKAVDRQHAELDKAIDRMHKRAETVEARGEKSVKALEDELERRANAPAKPGPAVPVLKMPPNLKTKALVLAASALGGIARDRLLSQRSRQKSTTTVNVSVPPAGFAPTAPSVNLGASFSPVLGTQAGTIAARTRAGTSVRKCKTDAPKRRKGICREGFFRETPTRTSYKVWATRKCK